MSEFEVTRADDEWRSMLSPERYAVLRQAATEPPFTGALLHVGDDGQLPLCRLWHRALRDRCEVRLRLGWPSFDTGRRAGGRAVDDQPRHGRTEMICGSCGGHLGHVFDDGPPGRRGCATA